MTLLVHIVVKSLPVMVCIVTHLLSHKMAAHKDNKMTPTTTAETAPATAPAEIGRLCLFNDALNTFYDIQKHNYHIPSCFSLKTVLPNWCTKCSDMYYRVCGMVQIKDPLLLIGKSSPINHFLLSFLA